MAKNKYNNKIVEFDGHKFDSQLECDYYKKIKYGPASYFYKNIILQPVYILQPAYTIEERKIQAIKYKADFEVENMSGGIETIDIKGFATATAKINRKIFEFKYPMQTLRWISYSKMDGGWICYDKLKQLRKERKKAREAKKK